MKFQGLLAEDISTLKLEEVKSEYQRSYLLIWFFVFILVVATCNFLLLHETVAIFYGGDAAFFTLVSFVLIFLLYQSLVLRYLKRKLTLSSTTSTQYKVVHTMIEISFPSTIILYMMAELKMLSFLDSPVAFVYFLFITLSILHLDFNVALFSGAFSAGQYILLVYYGFNHLQFDPEYEISTPQNALYIRGIVMVCSGAAAGFVSLELRKRIKSTFDFQEKKNQLERLFGQQVSKEVSRTLIEETGTIIKREATVMFLDIRNFTSFADAHTAEQVVDYQNRFLSPVIDIINQHQGVVFQILGDGLMACFGTPGANVLHADMAFQASLEILKQVRHASTHKLIPPTTIGIGLHSGQLVTGNIGNENRKQFSLSGTPVIIASRIEQLNKKYGTQLLISGQVYKHIAKGKMKISFLGEEVLRGLEAPVQIYSVC